MSDMAWSQVSKFEDGQNLDAETLNTPVSQLAERTEYLKRRLSNIGTGSAVIINDISVGAASKGNVVYFKADANQFVAAKADMDLYDDFTSSNSALVVGILINKSNDGTGDVLVYGQLNLDSSYPTANMLEEGAAFRPGRYYLSAKEAGKITADPTGPLIYVGSFGGSAESGSFSSGSMAVVNPQFLDIGTSHVHRVATLVARPAGDVDSEGRVLGFPSSSGTVAYLKFAGTWTSRSFDVGYSFFISNSGGVTKLCWGNDDSQQVPITINGDYVDLENGLKAKLVSSAQSVDNDTTWAAMSFPSAAQGWVDYEETDDDEGEGAKYEYVLGMDQYVSNLWPPVPARSASLVVNGVEMDNKDLLPDNPTVKFGRKTIYWYQDESGKTPWPEGCTGRFDEISPSLDKSMVMHWVRGFQCASGPVTSMQVRQGSPIKIYGYGSDKFANTGDLEIAADFDFEIADGGLPGYMVPKRGTGGKLLAGPVVEKIIGGPGVSVSSVAGNPQGQGVVTVSLGDATAQPFGDVALENAEQVKLGMFPYIRLKGYSGSAVVPSAFTASMRVPLSMPADVRYVLKMQATVFGEVSFSNQASQGQAGIKMEYCILPDYTGEDVYGNLKSGLRKPNSARNLIIPLGHGQQGSVSYNAFDPYLVTTSSDDTESSPDVIVDALGENIPYATEFSGQATVPYLRPGYLVGIRLSRMSPPSATNEYRGAIGFINMTWTLVPVSVD